MGVAIVNEGVQWINKMMKEDVAVFENWLSLGPQLPSTSALVMSTIRL